MTPIFKKKIVTLSEDTNYIKVNVLSDNKLKCLYPLKMSKSNESPYAFTNYEVAKFTANKILDPSRKVQFVFCINDLEIDINDTQKIDDYYQFYDNENKIKYYIKERKVHRLIKSGYLSFENGYNVRCDREYGIKRQHELLDWIEEIIDINLSSDESVRVLSKETIYGQDNSVRGFILRVKDTTARIYIVTNSTLMDINQDRKEKAQNCLPYNRNVDKFLTFAIFANKDYQERIYFDTDKRVNQIIEDIVVGLRNDLPGTSLDAINPCWVENEFRGLIKIDESRRRQII